MNQEIATFTDRNQELVVTLAEHSGCFYYYLSCNDFELVVPITARPHNDLAFVRNGLMPVNNEVGLIDPNYITHLSFALDKICDMWDSTGYVRSYMVTDQVHTLHYLLKPNANGTYKFSLSRFNSKSISFNTMFTFDFTPNDPENPELVGSMFEAISSKLNHVYKLELAYLEGFEPIDPVAHRDLPLGYQIEVSNSICNVFAAYCLDAPVIES